VERGSEILKNARAAIRLQRKGCEAAGGLAAGAWSGSARCWGVRARARLSDGPDSGILSHCSQKMEEFLFRSYTVCRMKCTSVVAPLV